MNRLRARSGFSLIEVLALLVMILIVVALVLPQLRIGHPRPPWLKCVSNLKNIGLAFRIYATDNEDRFPGETMLTNGVPLADITPALIYRSLSNELSTPKILMCPADKQRKPANDFASLQEKQISYFASVNASERTPMVFLAGDRNLTLNGVAVRARHIAVTKETLLGWSAELHNGSGNIAWADGSVQQFQLGLLARGVAEQAEWLATNHITIP